MMQRNIVTEIYKGLKVFKNDKIQVNDLESKANSLYDTHLYVKLDSNSSWRIRTRENKKTYDFVSDSKTKKLDDGFIAIYDSKKFVTAIKGIVTNESKIYEDIEKITEKILEPKIFKGGIPKGLSEHKLPNNAAGVLLISTGAVVVGISQIQSSWANYLQGIGAALLGLSGLGLAFHKEIGCYFDNKRIKDLSENAKNNFEYGVNAINALNTEFEEVDLDKDISLAYEDLQMEKKISRINFKEDYELINTIYEFSKEIPNIFPPSALEFSKGSVQYEIAEHIQFLDKSFFG